MDALTSLRVFREVVEAGSFVKAAERLDISTAMTSKHVANLERQLGVRLLNRTTRHLSLTEAGNVYYEQCSEALDILQAAEAGRCLEHPDRIERGKGHAASKPSVEFLSSDAAELLFVARDQPLLSCPALVDETGGNRL